MIFLLPLLSFSADIFIINPCGSHVNPRSVEWMISLVFLVQIRGLGGITLSKQCKAFLQFLWERVAVLAAFEMPLHRGTYVFTLLVDFFKAMLYNKTIIMYNFLNKG